MRPAERRGAPARAGRAMPARRTGARASAGAVTAEFAIVVSMFLMLVCGVIELARIIYMLNTLPVVTQRAVTAAANADFSDPATMSGVRQQAIFRASAGTLAIGAPVTDEYVRIDYLSLADAGGTAMAEIPAASLPSCPANNRITCMEDPYGASCIRLVRARICDPAVSGQCNRVGYQPLFSFVGMAFELPTATAVASVETLGAPPGAAPCP